MSTRAGHFRVWISKGADCDDATQYGPTFESYREAESHASGVMSLESAFQCIEIDEAQNPRPPVRRWVRRGRNWEAADVVSVVRVDVVPKEFTTRVAAELRARLKGTVKEEIKHQDGEITIISPFDALTLHQSVADAVQGIRQILALDPLDQGLAKVRITIR